MRLATLATILALTALPAFAQQQAPQDPVAQFWRSKADANAAEAADLYKAATTLQKQVAALQSEIDALKKAAAPKAEAAPVPAPKP